MNDLGLDGIEHTRKFNCPRLIKVVISETNAIEILIALAATNWHNNKYNDYNVNGIKNDIIKMLIQSIAVDAKQKKLE